MFASPPPPALWRATYSFSFPFSFWLRARDVSSLLVRRTSVPASHSALDSADYPPHFKVSPLPFSRLTFLHSSFLVSFAFPHFPPSHFLPRIQLPNLPSLHSRYSSSSSLPSPYDTFFFFFFFFSFFYGTEETESHEAKILWLSVALPWQ